MSTVEKALEDLLGNCLISVFVKGSNISLMDIQDYSIPMAYPATMCGKGSHYVYLVSFDGSSYQNNQPYFFVGVDNI